MVTTTNHRLTDIIQYLAVTYRNCGLGTTRARGSVRWHLCLCPLLPLDLDQNPLHMPVANRPRGYALDLRDCAMDSPSLDRRKRLGLLASSARNDFGGEFLRAVGKSLLALLPISSNIDTYGKRVLATATDRLVDDVLKSIEGLPLATDQHGLVIATLDRQVVGAIIEPALDSWRKSHTLENPGE